MRVPIVRRQERNVGRLCVSHFEAREPQAWVRLSGLFEIQRSPQACMPRDNNVGKKDECVWRITDDEATLPTWSFDHGSGGAEMTGVYVVLGCSGKAKARCQSIQDKVQ